MWRAPRARSGRTWPAAACALSIALSFVLACAGAGCKMQEGDSATLDPPPAKPSDNHVLIVHSALGDVAPLVRGEQDRAAAAGRQLVVYVGATWCEPCQRFHHAVEKGELDSTFPKLTLLEFDTERDNERLRAAGYASRFIPLFVVPNADGTGSSRRTEGGIKGDGAVGFVSAKLKELLQKS